MGLSFCSFASGSSGNCILVCSGETKILVDIGVSVKKVEESLLQLDKGINNMSVLVTHSHFDHIKYVSSFASKHVINVYAHKKTAPSLFNKHNNLRAGASFSHPLSKFSIKEISEPKNSLDHGFYSNHREDNILNKIIPFNSGDFYIGDITVSPFFVSHDVTCVGYSFYHRGKKLSIFTDLGLVNDDLLNNVMDSDAVLIEANHDTELVRENKNYSPWLKKRILSDKGHLSNFECGKTVLALVKQRTKKVVLAHLSEENNYPELAFSEVSSILSKNGIREGHDVLIEVAPKNDMTKLIEVV